MAEHIDNFSDLEDEDCDYKTCKQKDLESSFTLAASRLQSLVSKIETPTLLKVYALYKQATVGDCNIPKPSWYKMQEKTKWEAWNSLKNTDKFSAMEQYIHLLQEIDTEKSCNPADKPIKADSWAAVSTFDNKEVEIQEGDKTSFDHCKEGNIEQLKSKLIKSTLNDLDEEGLGLIHWAADRGNLEILDCLLKAGCDVNLQDQDGQTALHFSSSCDHIQCVQFLLDNGANGEIRDADGTLAKDLASNAEIKEMLK